MNMPFRLASGPFARTLVAAAIAIGGGAASASARGGGCHGGGHGHGGWHGGRGGGWSSGVSLSFSYGWPSWGWGGGCYPTYYRPAYSCAPRYYSPAYSYCSPYYYRPYVTGSYVYPSSSWSVGVGFRIGSANTSTTVGVQAAAPIAVAARPNPNDILVPVSTAGAAPTAVAAAPRVNAKGEIVSALAAIDRRDYSGAAVRLRAAMTADPAAFSAALAGDRDLAQRVSAAKRIYENPPRQSVGAADAQFMVAALDRLSGTVSAGGNTAVAAAGTRAQSPIRVAAR